MLDPLYVLFCSSLPHAVVDFSSTIIARGKHNVGGKSAISARCFFDPILFLENVLNNLWGF